MSGNPRQLIMRLADSDTYPAVVVPGSGSRLVADTDQVVLSKRVSAFLILFGVWSWIIWPTFLKNIWADPRSWHDGMTGFFGVHLALTAASLVLGTAVGWIGIRGWRLAARGSV